MGECLLMASSVELVCLGEKPGWCAEDDHSHGDSSDGDAPHRRRMVS